MNMISGIVLATLSLAPMVSCAQTETNTGEDFTVQISDKRYDPADSVKNYNKENVPLFAFVGERIAVDPLPYQQGAFDEWFKAKYRVIQKLYGGFAEDTIEFIIADHYGTPPLAKYKHVLLYVVAVNGTYYHEKYMYDPVYQTKDGRWAGPYDVQDYGHAYNKHTTVKPVKLDFPEEVSIPLKGKLSKDLRKEYYPEPYYRVEEEKAVIIFGNYVEDLLKLKQDGFLKARSQNN